MKTQGDRECIAKMPSLRVAWHNIFGNTFMCLLYELLKDITLNIVADNPFLMQFVPLEKFKNTNLLQSA